MAGLQERALIARHWFAPGKRVGEDLEEIKGPWTNPADIDDWGELIQAVLGFGNELPAAIAGPRSPLHAEIASVANDYMDAFCRGKAFAVDGDRRIAPWASGRKNWLRNFRSS